VEENVWEDGIKKDANKNLPSIQEEVQKFMNNQLRKGYIRQSKSPQMSPGFFVEKKDGSKQIVINYHNLNDQTVKNKYMQAPLSQQ